MSADLMPPDPWDVPPTRWSVWRRKLEPCLFAAVYGLSAALALGIVAGMLAGDLGLAWTVAWQTFVGACIVTALCVLIARA